MFWIGKYVGTHRARHFFTEIMKQRFDIHVVLRNKRVKQGFRGTQLETMKSCDFLFLLFLDADVYCDNLLACWSQSRNVVLRAFVILSWILIPKNVTHLGLLSDVTQTLIKTRRYCFRVHGLISFLIDSICLAIAQKINRSLC